MMQSKRNYYFLFIFFLFQSLKLKSEEERKDLLLLDRLIISINKTHYTQRDLEIYFFVKNILEENKIKEDLNEKTWNTFLAQFADEFLIYQTAREVAFYEKVDLEETQFLTFFKKIQTTVARDKKSNEKLIHLNPSTSELQIAFLNWRIIRSFIQQRDSINGTDFYSETTPYWFRLLKENSNIRLYKEAHHFESIHPL